MDIQKSFPQIQKNIPLEKYTTFKVGGPAKYFFIARKKEDIIKAIKTAKQFKVPFFILAGGSNVLISDEGFKGLIIKIQNPKFRIQRSKLYAEAGVPVAILVQETAKLGLSGLEWAAGLPGTLGGAIRGNAGAFKRAIENIVKEVEVLDSKNLKVKKIKNKNCQFDYRDSIFKRNRKLIILSATLRLKKYKKNKIKKKMGDCLAYRARKHPQKPSAGSIFKGVESSELRAGFFKKFPEAKKIVKEKILPAAFLISQCQIIGKKIGQAQISEKHPNFIINLGRAKATDVKKLINLIKNKVKNRFGITLKEEIQYLGF